jgi:hypothetical protein
MPDVMQASKVRAILLTPVGTTFCDQAEKAGHNEKMTKNSKYLFMVDRAKLSKNGHAGYFERGHWVEFCDLTFNYCRGEVALCQYKYIFENPKLSK